MNTQELFLYWIEERYEIYRLREQGHEKPWSNDPVFQTTYFCNVHRENDKVTKWIRQNWAPERVGGLDEYEMWMILARFLNWPDTLNKVKMAFREDLSTESGDFGLLQQAMEDLAESGQKVWGNAYVITSHGMPMAKATYLCRHLLPDAYRALRGLKQAAQVGTCMAVASALQRITGVGSFLAGQIVADLKWTPEHPLYKAPDKNDFVVPGPGSIRGLNWWHVGAEKGPVNERTFSRHLLVQGPRVQVDRYFNGNPMMPYIDNQDLQNCLCEFDKYMRVKTGSGRSKRKYHGF